MTTSDAAIEWLQKQIKAKDIAMYKALHKPNVPESELSAIEDAIEIIEYIIQKLKGEGA